MPKTLDQQARYTIKRVEFNLFGFNALQCEKYGEEHWEMVIHPQGCGPSDRIVVWTTPADSVSPALVHWRTEGGLRRDDAEDFEYAATKAFADDLLEVAEQMKRRWEKMVAKGKRLRAKWAAEARAAGEIVEDDEDDVEEAPEAAEEAA